MREGGIFFYPFIAVKSDEGGIFSSFFLCVKNMAMQCGKPFFSNTRQNGEWTETSTRQNEIELAILGE